MDVKERNTGSDKRLFPTDVRIWLFSRRNVLALSHLQDLTGMVQAILRIMLMFATADEAGLSRELPRG